MSDDKIYEIKVKDIEIGDKNVRLSNPLRDIEELAASIKNIGLLQPVTLLGTFGNPPYELISGRRRFLAHQEILKWKTIKAVFAGKLSINQAKLHSLVENIQRVELNHADISEAITALYKHFNKNERKVQKETGLSLRKVREYIHIEDQASMKMKKKLQQGKVTTVDVKRALNAAQGEIKKAEELLELMEEYKPTKYQKQRITKYGKKHKKASAKRILEEAMRPRVENKIMISLPEEIRQGLEEATKEFSKEVEEIVSEILEGWLFDQGFLNEQ